MYIIEALYLFATVISVVAMAPQIKQLLKTKQSEEFSLTTWSIWAVYQIIALSYAVTLGSLPFMLTNLAWIAFYTAMLTLIVRYRKNTPQPALQEVEEVNRS